MGLSDVGGKRSQNAWGRYERTGGKSESLRKNRGCTVARKESTKKKKNRLRGPGFGQEKKERVLGEGTVTPIIVHQNQKSKNWDLSVGSLTSVLTKKSD